LRALLEGMLQKDPEKRLSLPQIRQHPWVVQYTDFCTDNLSGSHKVQVKLFYLDILKYSCT
jgi:serine/threonine protein kinase